MLLAKSSSPVERRREAIAESFLSVKFTERKDPFGVSILPLGEGAESSSDMFRAQFRLGVVVSQSS
jgi:hypothetical protein